MRGVPLALAGSLFASKYLLGREVGYFPLTRREEAPGLGCWVSARKRPPSFIRSRTPCPGSQARGVRPCIIIRKIFGRSGLGLKFPAGRWEDCQGVRLTTEVGPGTGRPSGYPRPG